MGLPEPEPDGATMQMQLQMFARSWTVANFELWAERGVESITGMLHASAPATVAPQCLGHSALPLRPIYGHWLGPNGLSQSAVNAASGYLFLRTAKCHRLCGDSINQSHRIINNQRRDVPTPSDPSNMLSLSLSLGHYRSLAVDDFEKLPIKGTAKSSKSRCIWHQHQIQHSLVQLHGPCAKNNEMFLFSVPRLFTSPPLGFWWITRRVVHWQLSLSAANCFVVGRS